LSAEIETYFSNSKFLLFIQPLMMLRIVRIYKNWLCHESYSSNLIFSSKGTPLIQVRETAAGCKWAYDYKDNTIRLIDTDSNLVLDNQEGFHNFAKSRLWSFNSNCVLQGSSNNETEIILFTKHAKPHQRFTLVHTKCAGFFHA
jgi:hypothetical protein